MNGMNITAVELISVIKACNKSEVETLQFGDVSLKFYNNKHHNQNGIIASSHDVHGSAYESFQPTLPIDEVPTDNELAEDEYIAQLSIEDPGLYEELTIRKLMEEGR